MDKFIQYIQEAQKIIKTSDHITYVSYPLIRDKKILLKIVVEIKRAIACCINAILQYEYLFKRVKIYSDSKLNLRTFITKSAQRYNITPEEIKGIIELFEIVEKHKKSSMEIFKDDRVIILSDKMGKDSISLEKTKEFLNLGKIILGKTQENIAQNSRKV